MSSPNSHAISYIPAKFTIQTLILRLGDLCVNEKNFSEERVNKRPRYKFSPTVLHRIYKQRFSLQGQLFTLFVPLFSLSLLSKIVCSLLEEQHPYYTSHPYDVTAKPPRTTQSVLLWKSKLTRTQLTEGNGYFRFFGLDRAQNAIVVYSVLRI